ncbi:MAG TPA: tail fiber domain-containing protein [Fulvivirga sp.]|nr:tail fiber domain-containing protein [Fulvivirga sp.]
MKRLNKQLTWQRLALTLILLFLIHFGSNAQSASYYLNNAPITGSSNSGFGYRALFSNTSGNFNTATGYQALYSNTSGYNNTATGMQALFYNTTGYYNTATGYRALFSNSSGRFNTAAGYLALNSNSSGISNTATGYKALTSNTTGFSNTADGVHALSNNTTGEENSASGYQALYFNTIGDRNTAVGHRALYSNTSGFSNTAMGYLCLDNNTTGTLNAAFGAGALGGNTTATTNSAFGVNALNNVSSSSGNSAFGYSALSSTGTSNSAFGTYSLSSSGDGSYNTTVGFYASFANTSGSYNTVMGESAFIQNTTGSYNTVIGTRAGPTSINPGLVNSTALGYNTVNTSSNQVRVGNSSITSIGGQVSWSTLSDGRFKKDVKADIPGLEFINKLRPLSYSIDKSKLREFLGEETNDVLNENVDEVREIGFIAQDVEKVVMEMGYVFIGVEAPKNDNDHYRIRYAEFVVPLVKGMQEQQQMIEQQQQQIDDLKYLVAILTDKSSNAAGRVSDTETETETIPLVKEGISVYPNPNKGLFTVSTNTLDRGKIMIRNVSGVVVKTITLKENVFSYEIDLSVYAKGEYLINVLSGEKTITMRVIVE